jgi:hypothetical protein
MTLPRVKPPFAVGGKLKNVAPKINAMIFHVYMLNTESKKKI